MTTLMKASNQWATRPPDERYSSLAALHAACETFKEQAQEAPGIPFNTLRVAVDGDDVVLEGRAKTPARLTNWAFGQLSARIGAPASYLRTLPATLVADNLNYGLKGADEDNKATLLLQNNGTKLVRAFTTDKYTRIWNRDITSRLIRLTEKQPQWQPAPEAFDGSRGLYASDHDMFAFLVDNDRRIFEKGPGGGLGRGFFVWNSEVGAAVFGLMAFWYEYVCGNHRVWGAQGVREIRLRHVGNVDDRAFGQLAAELKKYANASVTEDEAKIESARKLILGKDKDEVLDKVFGLDVAGVTRKLIAEAYDLATQRTDRYGDPRSAWGLTGGMTEIASTGIYVDKRVEIDRAAGKILQTAF